MPSQRRFSRASTTASRFWVKTRHSRLASVTCEIASHSSVYDTSIRAIPKTRAPGGQPSVLSLLIERRGPALESMASSPKPLLERGRLSLSVPRSECRSPWGRERQMVWAAAAVSSAGRSLWLPKARTARPGSNGQWLAAPKEALLAPSGGADVPTMDWLLSPFFWRSAVRSLCSIWRADLLGTHPRDTILTVRWAGPSSAAVSCCSTLHLIMFCFDRSDL